VHDLIRGVTYTKSDVADAPGGGYLPVLRANNIRERVNFDDLVYVRADRISSEQMPKQGDYIIALSSGSKNLVGKAALMESDFEGGIGGFCGILRLASPGLQSFIGIYLASALYRDAIAGGSRGIGINNLQRKVLDSLPMPLPPLAEQHRIAAKVDELMSLLDQLDAALEYAEATRRDALDALLRDALGGSS
jgi:type I restriction enzyme S subunit